MAKVLKKAKWFFAAVLVGVLYQNCGDDVGFNELANSENPFGFGQSRKLIIDPNLADNRPPIQLTTIVDNSNSTQYIQDNLDSGFSKAIGQVQGFNVRASLHTISHDESKEFPATEQVDLVSFTDNNGDEQTLPASDIGLVPVNTNYVEKEVFQLTPSLFNSGKPLVYNVSSDNFDAFKNSYTSGISSLGTGGSAEELGLCTLFKKIEYNRQVEDPENSAYHLYILATNEDDVTTFANCPVETRKETRYVSSDKEVNCSAGEENCRFNYSIQQNSIPSKSASINYKYDRSTVKVHYSGTKIIEKITGTKAVTSHAISYEEKEATYSYKVKKTCYNDGIPEDCSLESRSAPRVNGACTVGSERDCNSSEKNAAAALFGVSASSLRYCKISCSDQWYGRNLPNNTVPNPTMACNSSPMSCSSADNSAVSSDAGSGSVVRNCSRTCSNSYPSQTITSTNGKNSCGGTTSRNCNGSELSSIAAKLGVSTGSVNSCSYSCQEKTINSNKTLTSYNGSCKGSDTRSCTSSDISWLMSKNPGFTQSNLNSCSVSCSTNSNNTGSLSISTSGLTCPSSNTCDASQLSQAAAQKGLSTGDINSCTASCSISNNPQPSCNLAGQTDLNLCSDTSKVASLCAALGRNDLNFGTCSRSGTGKKTVTTTTVDKQPKTTVTISDLDGVVGNTLPEMVASRLRSTHGEKGFYTSFFIHPSNDPTCVPPPNMSIGAKYEELTGELGKNNASTFPVCSNDYSPALDSIIKIAIQNVLNTFNLVMKDTEKVFKVEAIFLDDSKEVIPESNYEVFKKTIIFNNKELLKDVKSLEISVWRPD